MAYPPAYVRAYSFTDFETTNPGEPKPGNKLDTEYDAVANALTATQDALALIQRADGALANDSVGADQLQDDVFDGIVDGVTADAEAAAAAAAASAAAAAGSAAAAATSASDATTQAGLAAGSAALAGTSQSIAQGAAVDAADSAAEADTSADVAVAAANSVVNSVSEAQLHEELAFKWAELLTGPVLPAPPGWPEAVDDGMFSSKWWAIRARDYNSVHHIDLGTGQPDIGAAFDEWDLTNDLPLGLIYATWGTPPLEYALTDPSDPSDPASWTLISGGPGPPGPGNTLTIGTVTTGTPSAATITGVSPNQVLNLTLEPGPTGATGLTGPAGAAGAAGPANVLTAGTVTTGAPGSAAAVSITGTSPTQTINFTIPAGATGPAGPAGPTNFADPSVLIGLTATPGGTTNAMRADAAPALSQAITPTWTGLHTFSGGGPASASIAISSAQPTLLFVETDQAANDQYWFQHAAGQHFRVGTVDNPVTGSKSALDFTRSGNAITVVAFGNATDNPTYNFLGVSPVTSGGVHRGPAATQGAPTYSFSTDTDTGMWLSAPDTLEVVVGGNRAMQWSATAVLPMVVVRSFLDGTAAAPAYSFYNDTDTGIYRAAENIMDFSTGGAARFRVSDAGVMTFAPFGLVDGSAATPALFFINDPDTGFYRHAVDEIGVARGGARRFVFSSDLQYRAGARALLYNAAETFVGVLAATGTDLEIDARSSSNGIVRLYAGSSAYIGLQSVTIAAQPVWLADGSVGAPSLSFASDPDTGIYRAGGNFLAIATGGTLRAGWDGTTAFYQRNQQWNPNGTLGAPSYSFENDTNTGMYLYNTDTIAFSAGGVPVVYIANNYTQIDTRVYVIGGSATVPAICFSGSATTGIFAYAANTGGLTAGGVGVFLWDSTHIYHRAQTLAADGTANSPSYSFENDADTGIYRHGAETIGFSAAGILRVAVNPAGLYTIDGSVAQPVYSFLVDQDTGMYRVSSDRLALVAGGVDSLHVGTNFVLINAGVQLVIQPGSVGTPHLNFVGDQDTGIYRIAADDIGIATGGTSLFAVSSSRAAYRPGFGNYPFYVDSAFTSAAIRVVTTAPTSGGAVGDQWLVV